ncbi:NAD-dependent epimerase/dehydratase family protein [Nocardioides pocheonensis]|uniref:NAD-dependent epimerase/dehydratase family protein n=1 Tax=Nocardioides pocheonensis TaxID=661485 RepID=A0A3N0GMF5_9ACTN|nr:NAD-dependent epimerase/dehydratase family protein [Nocardioides pocheonensis]RNM13643.1 NAD-dependent epimerase/dehydratase family protein [Nocardioides pocheonensis]
MSDRHVIIGAGPVGQAVATVLAERGADVVLASRSGKGPELAGARRVAVDAADAEELSRLTEGAQVLYNCVNPPRYDAWAELWPPVAAALLTAAERTGAVLAVTGNLYPYGPLDRPMVEGMPDAAPGKKAQIRARMTADALAAHKAGRIRTVEVRGSDYVGAPLGDHAHVPRVVPAALEGKTVRVIGDAHQPHTWTDVHDMGRALVATAGNESALGRVWHAPSNPPRTQAEAVNDVLASVGRPPVTVKAYPRWVVRGFGLLNSQMRELQETEYQFTRTYVMDSSAITAELGLAPTPWDEVCRRTAG